MLSARLTAIARSRRPMRMLPWPWAFSIATFSTARASSPHAAKRSSPVVLALNSVRGTESMEISLLSHVTHSVSDGYRPTQVVPS